ncbi:PREDICTED: uncharacterized protein LOC108770484 [Trachymyrmex cornetzi]|uniref:uncharacterized protein LOC108770484 n=1 Tax=Trachymyrmex cornetzi TaxID=471704 RepID=UPI00084F0048|nr:PREDICTED: uncharacterized protein LOC108770484 [Trachymyrmex cornetzi]
MADALSRIEKLKSPLDYVALAESQKNNKELENYLKREASLKLERVIIPGSNGTVERFHRQLKAAIRCHENDRWTETLPTVLLGIRAAWKDDLQATSELVYGETLRLPGQFLFRRTTDEPDNVDGFVKKMRNHFEELRPLEAAWHCKRKTFIYKDLVTTEAVFVRHDASRTALHPTYNGPYAVLERGDKSFVVRVHGKNVTVSIDRLKPAYIVSDKPETRDIPRKVDEPNEQNNTKGNEPR